MIAIDLVSNRRNNRHSFFSRNQFELEEAEARFSLVKVAQSEFACTVASTLGFRFFFARALSAHGYCSQAKNAFYQAQSLIQYHLKRCAVRS